MITLLLVAVIVVCFSFGDVLLTRGMKQVGEIASFRPRALLDAAGDAIRSPFVLAGVGLQVVAFITFLVALSRDDLSYVFPLTATSDIITTLAARFFLGERVTRARWAGVLLVTAGIGLIVFT